MSKDESKKELYQAKFNFFEKVRIDDINRVAKLLISVQPMTNNVGEIFQIKPRYLKSPWKKKFVWFPVKTISGKRYWLKSIYVRSYSVGSPNNPIIEYGDTFDILKDSNGS